jgi:LacI family transcriptional regulator
VTLGYQPNAIARALATQRTRTIGLIVGDIADSYFAEIARGVEDTAGPHGYLTIICNADRTADTELAYFRMLLDHKVAAIIFSGGLVGETSEAERLRQAVARAQEESRRVIALAPRDFAGVPTLAIDNRAVAYDMTRYLIQLGHRSIGFVGGPKGVNTAIHRREGFVSAMGEAGLGTPMIYDEGFSLEAGRRAALTMLTRTMPTAVLAATDDAAIGALTTFRQAGIEVPGQVSVAGIDDSQMAEVFDLTTVKIAKYELGAMAARHVVEAPPGAPLESVVVPHRLVTRGTTRFRKGEPNTP